ncbi:hydrogenase subunit MbhD domain-containing protein, partial [Rhizobiaceae sp. 2RAB30]
ETHLGTRRLQPQLRVLVAIAFVAALWPIMRGGVTLRMPDLGSFDPIFAMVWAVGIVCAIGAAVLAKYHRLAALVLMGGAGLVTCITFVWLSAPDLAATQLVVEIVTTILILLGLRWLPKRLEQVDTTVSFWGRLRRYRDATLAIVSGAGMALISYVMMTTPV